MGKRRRPGDDAFVRLVTEWACFMGSWEGTGRKIMRIGVTQAVENLRRP